MRIALFVAALCLTGCVENSWAVTETADEVVREKEVKKSVRVVPYVEPPRAVAPVGGSGVNAPAGGHGASAGARCHGGKCREVGKKLHKAVSKLRRR